MKAWATPQAIDAAARRCARGKFGRPDVIAFRRRWGEEILGLASRLASGRYRPEPGIAFVTSQPKHREIHAAAFRDRVVHHLLHDVLEPRFEPAFIAGSFACRKGKGTHAAAARLQDDVRRVTRGGQVRAYALQMDVRSFFVSIHRPTLLRQLFHRVPEPELRRLIETLVRHDAAAVARRQGDPRAFARVPEHKRLGAAGADHGLPIGNLTSQFFANVYLDALDQFAKRGLGARHYLRYVDDLVILHRDPAVLSGWEARIREFLGERLGLRAHPAIVTPAASGVDFVGYVVRPDYVLPRRRVTRNLQARLAKLEAPLRPVTIPADGTLDIPGVGCIAGPCMVTWLSPVAVESLRAAWASYEGHLRHANAWRIRERLWAAHPVSQGLLLRTRSGGITRRFSSPRGPASFREQLRDLARGARAALLLVQVGDYLECPARLAARRLGMSVVRRGRRRWAVAAPWTDAPKWIRRGLERGRSIALVLEEDEAAGNVKARRVTILLEPVAAPGIFASAVQESGGGR